MNKNILKYLKKPCLITDRGNSMATFEISIKRNSVTILKKIYAHRFTHK